MGLILGMVVSVTPMGIIIILTEINAPEVFLIAAGIPAMIAMFPLHVLANLISPDISNFVNLLVLITFWGTIGLLCGMAIEQKNNRRS